jgi:hypothetical protein
VLVFDWWTPPVDAVIDIYTVYRNDVPIESHANPDVASEGEILG